ncbi:hypothetical protein [Brachybacterium kimchii]|uniref:DUF4229 domain-containing protein n=1 Tax=Brachybacterium kimchii TaxID=2942909 RepID=A0ABY4N534_9MICO|nr:hypothetical protein [Brachybacterium kimchii]UQN29667.1 hypothetical protein M4486_18880 [Brachybacterium kimchii]
MTAVHVLVLVAGVVAAIVLSDLLGHRGIGAWPVGLLALALVPVAGYFYSPWIAALSLGLAFGAGIMLLGTRIRSLMRERRIVRDAREARKSATESMLRRNDGAP